MDANPKSGNGLLAFSRFLVVFLLAVTSMGAWSQGTGGFWSATGNMTAARCEQTATLLKSGRVLVAGGWSYSGGYLYGSELYDPTAGTWNATGTMVSNGPPGSATLLASGKVLIAGWINVPEIYDPLNGTWSDTGAMLTARDGNTVTLLDDGKVLVAGGVSRGGDYLTTAELYDPGTGTWTPTGTMSTGRAVHTATMLTNGTVLVAGGWSDTQGYLSSAELFSPVSGTWSATGTMGMGRYHHTATLLPGGNVLVAGGENGVAGPGALDTAELYDSATGTWSATGNLLWPTSGHTATMLPDGRVLLAGGGIPDTAGAEVYDPATQNWSAVQSMSTGRYYHTTTLLTDGRVLVAGGHGDGDESVLSTAELYANCLPLSFSPSSLADAVTGVSYNQMISASGGTGPYTCSVASGTLPSGLTLNSSGFLSGVPTEHGAFDFTITATDANSCTGSAAYTLTVSLRPPAVTSLTKAGSPFRIIVRGINLQSGLQVFINGVPWSQVTWKNTGKLIITGGAALKAAVPKGQIAHFRFVNPDGGEETFDWTW